MSDSQILRISAGRGPYEARRFVAMLAVALGDHLAARHLPILSVEHHGDREAPSQVALRTDHRGAAAVPEFIGTHLLIAALRGPRARRRWFAAIDLDDGGHRVDAVPLDPQDLTIRCVRARGPGGQNVNKRATAVQITHRPTAITVRSDAHRTQSRNRAAALDNLRRAIAHQTHQADDRRQLEAWRARHHLLTRRPVMHWRLSPCDPRVVVAMTKGCR